MLRQQWSCLEVGGGRWQQEGQRQACGSKSGTKRCVDHGGESVTQQEVFPDRDRYVRFKMRQVCPAHRKAHVDLSGRGG